MATLASDNFNRANSTSLGSDWTEQEGNWEIVSNELSLNTHSGGDNLTWDTALNASPAADYDVSAKIKLTTTGGLRVIGRWQDVSNYYYLEVNTVSQVIRLRKRIAGVNTTIGTYTGGYSVNIYYTIKMTMAGSNFAGWIDGVNRITTVSDTAISATGKPGISADSAGKIVDDFLVEGTAAATTAIKKVSSVAYASIKKISGVAIASVKKVAGLA